MATEVRLKHEASGMVEKAVIGFSWTTLFFGIFVPLIRGDWKWVFIGLAIAFCTMGILSSISFDIVVWFFLTI